MNSFFEANGIRENYLSAGYLRYLLNRWMVAPSTNRIGAELPGVNNMIQSLFFPPLRNREDLYLRLGTNRGWRIQFLSTCPGTLATCFGEYLFAKISVPRTDDGILRTRLGNLSTGCLRAPMLLLVNQLDEAKRIAWRQKFW